MGYDLLHILSVVILLCSFSWLNVFGKHDDPKHHCSVQYEVCVFPSGTHREGSCQFLIYLMFLRKKSVVNFMRHFDQSRKAAEENMLVS